MRLHSIVLNEAKLPTYLAAKFTKQSAEHLHNLGQELKIENLVGVSDFHVTILWSVVGVPLLRAKPILDNKVIAKGFAVWPTSNGKNVLVLLLDAPSLQKRHEEINIQHRAFSEFPLYVPHVTLSYDLGDNTFDTTIAPNIPALSLKNEYIERT